MSEANGSAADAGPGESGPNVRGEEVDPLRRALELCVYAPLGLALTAVEDLPAVAAKGRDRVELEVSNARVVGRYMVARARHELTGRLGVGRKGEGGARAGHHTVESPEAGPAGPGPDRPAPDRAAAEIVERALADYDTLSASQVVRRLESLGPEQLQAVQRYEASTRNRRTILNRAGQLLEEGPPAGAAE